MKLRLSSEKLGRGACECVNHVINNTRDEVSIVAFAHDADDGLRARGPNDKAPLGPEPLTRRFDRGYDRVVLKRLAVGIAHVLEDLRQRLEAVAHFAHRPANPLDDAEKLQRCDQAIAGSGVIRQDDVSGLLAANVVAVLAHMFENVAVADCCPDEVQAQAAEKALKPKVRHDGGHNAGLR